MVSVHGDDKSVDIISTYYYVAEEHNIQIDDTFVNIFFCSLLPPPPLAQVFSTCACKCSSLFDLYTLIKINKSLFSPTIRNHPPLKT